MTGDQATAAEILAIPGCLSVSRRLGYRRLRALFRSQLAKMMVGRRIGTLLSPSHTRFSWIFRFSQQPLDIDRAPQIQSFGLCR